MRVCFGSPLSDSWRCPLGIDAKLSGVVPTGLGACYVSHVHTSLQISVLAVLGMSHFDLRFDNGAKVLAWGD